MMFNGANRPFGQTNFSGMPNMAETITGWFQSLTFNVVSKVVENGLVTETTTDITFRGVWQPFGPEQLQMKPEHQRSWQWIQVHSHNNLKLVNDDVIKFRGEQYRVMANFDYSLNGYYEFHLIKDYSGSGPEVIP